MIQRSHILVLLTAAAAGGALGLPAALGAQGLGPLATGDTTTLVDRVVAIVGDSVIMLSEVQEGVQVAQVQLGRTIDPGAVLDELVNTQLVLQAAARDTTLKVETAVLDERVEAAMQAVRDRFPTDLAFQEALRSQKMTPQSYRDEIRYDVRAELLGQMYIQRALQEAAPVAVSEGEMRDYFEAQRGQLESRPEIFRIEQVVVEPTPSDEAWDRARAIADSLRTLVVGGADFAELAREHSDDPSVETNDGDLGWFRRGNLLREFEDVAFAQPDGAVSAPVRTEVGYHVILTEKRRPGEVKARHILIQPEVSGDEEARALERAREVVERARAGEPMEALREEFGLEQAPPVVEVSRDQFAEVAWSDALAAAAEGEVLGPFATPIQGKVFQTVLKVAEIREAGDFTFEDFRSQISLALTQQKRIERIYQRLREGTYVDIRM